MAERHTDELEALLRPSETEVAVSRMLLLQQRVGVVLDVVWMLAVSAGVGWVLWAKVGGGYGLLIGGAALMILTQTAAALRDREPKPEPKSDLITPKPLPGPKDAGPLHMSGG